eukprot:353244-Chlamydomonas_euryale.AAC.4
MQSLWERCRCPERRSSRQAQPCPDLTDSQQPARTINFATTWVVLHQLDAVRLYGIALPLLPLPLE